ncbi:MAG TPA: DNA translocase FtsK 4TM domain-containing protein [Patescibacteria group bacterium]|nr:DNA translocase FtsK 4TM domain-containing protein [Patescibacteria group bacterium]
MAKKKKQSKSRKKADEEIVEKSPFWPLASAVLLVVLGLFLLLGGFGTGGALPKGLFDGAYWTFGVAAYLVPFAFVYWAATKFRTEDHRIPLGNLFSVIGVMVFSAAWLFTAFASRLPDTSWVGGHGGTVGSAVGGLARAALDGFPASLMFTIFILLCVFFAFGISPKVLLGLGRIFRKRGEDGELAQLKANAEAGGFKLNEGVPVEHHGSRQFAGLRNSAEKLAPADNHSALTIASDPNWQFPSVALLDAKQDKADAGDVAGNAKIIEETFGNFNIEVEMEGANVGPRVTQYTLKPPANVKLTKITALENNLALDLAAHSIRMEAPIPGKRAVGIEVPNVKSATVRLRSLFESHDWTDIKGPLSFVIGRDIAGKPVVADLTKMPHLLVAGQTGSGKSVMINTILTSLLYRNSPSDLKLILVDPKQVELKPYDEIPHLLTPVITEPEKCISALKWATAEMERRYSALAAVNKRNIAEYNMVKKEEGMPYIVIVIDELADLMMMAARDVEALVVRIAQKARAVGIHLVLATQRPSVDVITGLIKANVPARIAFTTASQVDSRTIIDQIGAEKLLGQGDMLLLTADMPKPKRVQGAFIDEPETAKVTDFIRMQRPPQYDDEIISQPVQLNGKGGIVADMSSGSSDDDMFKDAVRCVIEGRKASTSLLQRRLRIGYGRAARLIEEMEEQGIVGPADGQRPREVLVSSLDEVFGSPAAAEPVASPDVE